MDDLFLKEAAYAYRNEILEPYNELIDIVGFEGICAISEQFGGRQIYVPSKRTIFGECVRKQMISEFNGRNDKQLSRKYGMCLKTVKNIVGMG